MEYSRQLSPFKTISLGFILKTFLKFRNFQPQCSYATVGYEELAGELESIRNGEIF